MTPAIVRWTFLFSFCLGLVGCSTLANLNPIILGDEDLFVRGLDAYRESGDLALLKKFPDQYPASDWRPRAEAIVELATQRRRQEARLENLEKGIDHCRQERELLAQERESLDQKRVILEQEIERLEQDNQSLETTLERLKQVLIDTELQAK